MSSPSQVHREEITFPPNLPITVNMKYAQPKLISGQHGERYLFTTVDNRVFFLDPPVAGQIAALGINVREEFMICKRTSGKQGAPIAWEVARITGEQADGTFAIPKEPENPPAPKPMARAGNHTSSLTLAEEAKAAVDAYAEVLQYGLSTHNGKVKPDEIQRIFTTVYIQRKGAA